MSLLFIGGAVLASALASLFFSTLTYALRDFSRARLSDILERRRKLRWLDPTLAGVHDLIFVTAAGRLLANVLVLLSMLRLMAATDRTLRAQYFLATACTLLMTLVVSVALPHAFARHAAATIVGTFVRFLHALRWVMTPVTKIMHWTDSLVRRAASNGTDTPAEQEAERIEEDILSAVEEGEKEGLVDEHEREMIRSVIEFRGTEAGRIMTPRPEIVAIEAGTPLEEVKQVIEANGLSRIPVYQGTLDNVIGILYARDLLKYLGLPPDRFDIYGAIRPPYFVPETKPLPDLLRDFRLQKIHIAIVLDEYGGTSGLVTIEDVLEELVGEISDEHEPMEQAMLKRLDDTHYEADARIQVEELNRLVGLTLPEDADYDTLGGFVSVTLGRIPTHGASFDYGGAKFTVIEAEPAKVSRVAIEVLAQQEEPAEVAAGASA